MSHKEAAQAIINKITANFPMHFTTAESVAMARREIVAAIENAVTSELAAIKQHYEETLADARLLLQEEVAVTRIAMKYKIISIAQEAARPYLERSPGSVFVRDLVTKIKDLV